MKARTARERIIIDLVMALTQYDRTESARERKRGRENIYRLGLLYEAVDRVKAAMPTSALDSSSPEALRLLASCIRANFTLRCTDKLAKEIEASCS